MRDSDDGKEDTREMEEKRAAIVRAVSAFKPAETVFEVSTRGKAGTANAALMKERRKALAKAVERAGIPGPSNASAVVDAGHDGDVDLSKVGDGDMEMANEEDIVVSLLCSMQVSRLISSRLFSMSLTKRALPSATRIIICPIIKRMP
jgi:ATP-dependent RNA helicase DDX54/DBP10